ncbi:Putative ribonuclease H protein At1g65750 [Linum grandiflorum]
MRTLGRSFSHSFMTSRLQAMWARQGWVSVWDVEAGNFVARFEEESDFNRALCEGPWLVSDHYVISEEWRPNFEPGYAQVHKIRAWVRLPSLPLEYFDAEILSMIGDKLGKTVRIDILGITATQNLGRYLGIPIIHGRNSKNLYNYLLDRMDQKFVGWKLKTLSFAGRVSLAQSVLNLLPTYAMQTSYMPFDVCDQIDQRIRNFIWGSDGGSRKIYLVNREMVCRPKSDGGLSLHSARELNKAFLMKLIWGMMKRPSELWVEVLKTKYLRQTSVGLAPYKTKRVSLLWCGLNDCWPLFAEGLSWGIRNGQRVNFWREKWMDGGLVLGDLVDIPPADSNCMVADFCTPEAGWDVARLQRLLPPDLVESVVGMTPPIPTLGDDYPCWGLTPNGEYSVRSGYNLASHNQDEADPQIWKLVWRWSGLQRIRQLDCNL